MIRRITRIAFLIAILCSTATPQTVDNFKATFILRLKNECLTGNWSAKQGLTDNQIAQMCDCVSSHGAEVITMQDLYDDVAGTNHELQTKIKALISACTSCIVRPPC